MDGSHLPSDKRYVLLDKEVADLIENIETQDLKFLLEMISTLKDCECGCRGRSHITITTDDGGHRRYPDRLRHEPAVPNFQAYFRGN